MQSKRRENSSAKVSVLKWNTRGLTHSTRRTIINITEKNHTKYFPLDKPKRIQRLRTRGFKMPENTVYVGRPTKWGNPYPVGNFSREQAYYLFKQFVEKWDMQDEIKAELKGKNLACWCRLGELCHADVLLEIANS